MNADYKANALAKAKIYQKQFNKSKDAIYDQLVSPYGEEFTEEEANYAIQHLDD
ncbi:Ltp family lipoprotein [Streptococcus oralis]|uniref:Ltp family lipoprotein n=1 Tax=Streptococcus oralis TaxID=1303 RepID=UPI003F52FE97